MNGCQKWPPAAMASVVLEPGRSYAIRLEYFDDVGDARVRLGYVTGDTQSSKPRTVFIPEGEWIYTVTGETVYGPQTITVQCDIRQMPIFVRKGAVIPLADETLTVQGSDWSHLTLDFYPSTRQFAETYLYEDDTMSNAYELGQFRTTALSTSFEGGKAILRIGGRKARLTARGRSMSGNGPSAYRPGGWGELTGVTVNGKSAPFTRSHGIRTPCRSTTKVALRTATCTSCGCAPGR